MTYPFEIPVDHPLTMHIYQAPRNIAQLWGATQPSMTSEDCRSFEQELTSLNRFISRFVFTKVLRSPFFINSDTIANRSSVTVTPSSGNTFGWSRTFHVTNSLQNLYGGFRRRVSEYIGASSVIRNLHGNSSLKCRPHASSAP